MAEFSVVNFSSRISVRSAGSAGGGGGIGSMALSFTSIDGLGLFVASSSTEDDSLAIVSWIASVEGVEPSSDEIS